MVVNQQQETNALQIARQQAREGTISDENRQTIIERGTANIEEFGREAGIQRTQEELAALTTQQSAPQPEIVEEAPTIEQPETPPITPQQDVTPQQVVTQPVQGTTPVIEQETPSTEEQPQLRPLTDINLGEFAREAFIRGNEAGLTQLEIMQRIRERVADV